jgi:CRP-like cAMP-binding protein
MSALLNFLIRRLEQAEVLSAEEKHAVMALGNGRTRHVSANTCVAGAGLVPDAATLIVRGVACRSRALDDGRRQINGYLFQGDLCHLEACLLDLSAEPVTALSCVEVLTLPRPELLHLIDRFPRMLSTFWRLTAVEHAMAHQWMMNLGRRSAFAATAHLLCEIFVRLQAAGLADGNSCELHMTQADLADSLGLTPVHVNRTLMALRRRDLIALRDRRLVIIDFPALSSAGGFNADYLHLPAAPALRGLSAPGLTLTGASGFALPGHLALTVA